MEKVKCRFSFFGVSETVIERIVLQHDESKTGSEEFLKTFLIVSQNREFADIFLFFSFYTSSYRMPF